MYLIQKHSVQVGCHSKELAYQFKDELRTVLYQEFYPKLEVLLDQYDVPDQVCEIKQLPVKITIENSKNWKTAMVQQAIDQIALFLKSQQLNTNAKITNEICQEHNMVVAKSRVIYVQELFLEYLEKGILSSNSLMDSLEKLLDEVEVNSNFVLKLKKVLVEDITNILRWYLNVPERLKQQFFSALPVQFDKSAVSVVIQSIAFRKVLEAIDDKNIKKAQNIVHFLYWVYIVKPTKREVLTVDIIHKIKAIAVDYFKITMVFFEAVISAFSDDILEASNPFISYIVQISEKVVAVTKPQNKNTNVFEEFNKLQRDRNNIGETIEKSTNQRSEEALYIENAGLVLLHPFLFPLFQKLGYLRDSAWKNKELQHRAVLVTQYLVNSDDTVFESELFLNKLLCGVPRGEPIATNWSTDLEEVVQCRKLLESVIEHWKILGNTSPKGLQNTFLQREGKLTKQKNGNYKLVISQTGVDVLLMQLPWGLGMLKTPWMEQFVDCIWN